MRENVKERRERMDLDAGEEEGVKVELVEGRGLICEQRNLPARGFRPAVLLLAMGGVMTYGFYRVGQGIREQKYVLLALSTLLRWRISVDWPATYEER